MLVVVKSGLMLANAPLSAQTYLPLPALSPALSPTHLTQAEDEVGAGLASTSDSARIISTPSHEGWQILLAPDKNLVVRLREPLQLSPAHWELIKVGTPLPLQLELTLYQPRWWGWDKVLAQVILPLRMGYEPISKIYWFSRLGTAQSFTESAEMQNNVLHFDWPALPEQVLIDGPITASLILSIDRLALPMAIQVDVRPNKTWQWSVRFPNRTIKQ